MIGLITTDGYSFRHTARSGQTLSVRITLVITKSFECLDAYITSDGIIFRIMVVYGLHPKHKKNGINSKLFFTEFADLISKHILLPGKILFLGDFNIYWNIPTDSNTLKLNDILGSFRLKQHVRVPTHTNMLDLVIICDDDNFIGNVIVNGMMSDHVAVDIKLAISKPRLEIREQMIL